MERRVGVLVAVVVGMLAAVTPVMAQEAQPSSAPAAVTEPAATPAPAPEASSMPAATPLSPVAEATPAAPAAPAATPTPAAGPKERKYGYLAVLGVGSMAAGAVSLALAGASLLNPFVVLNGLNFIERDTDGLVIPGTGTSINPFYALGGVLLVLGITLGTAGLVMLGVETYLNGGF